MSRNRLQRRSSTHNVGATRKSQPFSEQDSAASSSREVSEVLDNLNPGGFVVTNVSDDISLYRPHGKWAFMADRSIDSKRRVISLSTGRMCSAYYDIITVNSLPFPVICKEWDIWRDWDGFYSELFLYSSSKHLRQLQGICVPWVIGVVGNIDEGVVSILMEPPHGSTTGWTEAHPITTPAHIKEKIIEAYQTIHDAGVLHNDVELRHILITDDENVCIIDWQQSRSLIPNEDVDVKRCTVKELEAEMRKVRYLIDYDDARAQEDEAWENGDKLTFEGNRLEARRRWRGEEIDGLSDEDWDEDSREWFRVDPRPQMFEYKNNPLTTGRRFDIPQSQEDQERMLQDRARLSRQRKLATQAIMTSRSHLVGAPHVAPGLATFCLPTGSAEGSTVSPYRVASPTLHENSPAPSIPSRPPQKLLNAEERDKPLVPSRRSRRIAEKMKDSRTITHATERTLSCTGTVQVGRPPKRKAKENPSVQVLRVAPVLRSNKKQKLV